VGLVFLAFVCSLACSTCSPVLRAALAGVQPELSSSRPLAISSPREACSVSPAFLGLCFGLVAPAIFFGHTSHEQMGLSYFPLLCLVLWSSHALCKADPRLP